MMACFAYRARSSCSNCDPVAFQSEECESTHSPAELIDASVSSSGLEPVLLRDLLDADHELRAKRKGVRFALGESAVAKHTPAAASY